MIVSGHVATCCNDPELTLQGLSKDTVEVARKKVEARSKKIETTRAAQKPNFEVEVDKLVSGASY
jgi:hypothetical protein